MANLREQVAEALRDEFAVWIQFAPNAGIFDYGVAADLALAPVLPLLEQARGALDYYAAQVGAHRAQVALRALDEALGGRDGS